MSPDAADPGEPVPSAAPDESIGEAVLLDLPAALWGALLRAVRRAVESWDRTDLPAGLRPFVGWRPETLVADRPRRAVAAALAADGRLREAVGAALDDRAVWEASATTDAGRLTGMAGTDDVAAAALAARARWGDLAVLAAGHADTAAAHRRATAESRRAAADRSRADELRRLAGELAAARTDRDGQRRRADAAEVRARRADGDRGAAAARVAALEERAAGLAADLAAARREHDRRTARLRRRLDEAEARGRVDADRIGRLAGELEAVAAGLRDALRDPVAWRGGAAVGIGEGGSRGSGGSGGLDPGGPTAGAPGPPTVAASVVATVALPRTVVAARAGRPCGLPPGVRPGEPLAVEALLRVPGIEVVLDGYNVTKDLSGRPAAPLADQRRWLLGVCAGLGGRFPARCTVVFDGTEVRPPGLSVAPRGVRVRFSAGEEIADTVVLDLVAALDPAQPVLVVSGDREVVDGAGALHADVAPPRSFLAAAGA